MLWKFAFADSTEHKQIMYQRQFNLTRTRISYAKLSSTEEMIHPRLWTK